MYQHFSPKERFSLETLLSQDYELWEIAQIQGRSPSSLSRELKRNSRPDGSYEARYAQMKAKRRRKCSKVSSRKIESNAVLAARIEARLHPLVSPEVIAHDEPVCVETIYAWIYRSRPELKLQLAQHGRKRRRYGTKRAIKQGWTRDVRSIGERSLGAINRSRVGHFEGDTIRLHGGAILTHTDRKSRFEIVHLMRSEESGPAHLAIKSDAKLQLAKSITYDRGSTFSQWRMIERDIKAKVYFANAHHPWERGTNENSNGRLRRVFPKGTRYTDVKQEMLDEAVYLMNNTKRKCLNWRTPKQVFMGRCTSK